jgi:hypothetical protein
VAIANIMGNGRPGTLHEGPARSSSTASCWLVSCPEASTRRKHGLHQPCAGHPSLKSLQIPSLRERTPHTVQACTCSDPAVHSSSRIQVSSCCAPSGSSPPEPGFIDPRFTLATLALLYRLAVFLATVATCTTAKHAHEELFTGLSHL